MQGLLAQELAEGLAFSAAGDQRDDKLSWRSSAPNVARISSDGRLTALAPGKTTITAYFTLKVT